MSGTETAPNSTTQTSEAVTTPAATTETKVVETPVATPAAEPAKTPEANAEPVAKTDEVKSGAEKKEAPAAPVVPEKYELALPENTLLPKEFTSQVEAFAKEQGFTNAQAQAVLNRESEFAQARVGELENLAKNVWPENIKKDVELAGKDGSELAVNLERAKHAVARFDTDGELRKILDTTGLGNHPNLVKVWARIGRAMAEDSIGGPGNHGGAEKTAAEVLYPSHANGK